MDWLLQLTFFLACFVLTERRIAASRFDWLCCFARTPAHTVAAVESFARRATLRADVAGAAATSRAPEPQQLMQLPDTPAVQAATGGGTAAGVRTAFPLVPMQAFVEAERRAREALDAEGQQARIIVCLMCETKTQRVMHVLCCRSRAQLLEVCLACCVCWAAA